MIIKENWLLSLRRTNGQSLLKRSQRKRFLTEDQPEINKFRDPCSSRFNFKKDISHRYQVNEKQYRRELPTSDVSSVAN